MANYSNVEALARAARDLEKAGRRAQGSWDGDLAEACKSATFVVLAAIEREIKNQEKWSE